MSSSYSTCTDTCFTKYRHYSAGTYPGRVNRLKTVSIGNDRFTVAVAGEATPDSVLYNPKTAPTSYLTGREYTTMSIREYNKLLTSQRDAIWYSTLKLDPDNGQYRLAEEPTNITIETDLDFSAASGFNISNYGVLFIANELGTKQEYRLKLDVYYLSTSDLTGTRSLPKVLTSYGLEDTGSLTIFSLLGRQALFCRKLEGSTKMIGVEWFLSRDSTTQP